jgi:hypothetical protein
MLSDKGTKDNGDDAKANIRTGAERYKMMEMTSE